MPDERFDLVVIGTGSGLDVAGWAADLGWRVAIVEKGDMGGTCLNRGCIPSKMLLHSADVAETIRTAPTFGIQPRGGFDVDYAALMKRVRDHVDGSSAMIAQGLRASENPRLFEGQGRFIGHKRLRVGDHTTLIADRFLLATGARPRIPETPGLREVGFWTSTDALRVPARPASIAILGGGFIAAELGHFFGALGTKVTIIHKHDVLLPREDREVSEEFTAAFASKHRVLLRADTTRIEKATDGARLHVRTPEGVESIDVERILVAVGITPNSDTLDLQQTGVEVDKAGRIVVDEFLETRAKGIFALGDAVGRFDLKHNANHEAQYAFANMQATTEKIPVDYSVMPRAVFSSPQVASVGQTEAQLQASGVAYLVGRNRYYDSGMGKALDARVGFVKLLVDPETRTILGGHIIGPDASTLIHEVVIAMSLRAPVDELARAIHIHPALSEIVQRAAGNVAEP